MSRIAHPELDWNEVTAIEAKQNARRAAIVRNREVTAMRKLTKKATLAERLVAWLNESI